LSILSLLTQSADFQRSTFTKDAVGGQSTSWATRTGLGTVACRLVPASHRTTLEFQRDDARVVYELHTATDVTATTQDRVLIGSSYYRVLGYKPSAPLLGLSVYRTILSKLN
jgi:hypothetical protein